MLDVKDEPPVKSEGAQHVFITVSGGVAYAANVPPGIRVHILDYDDIAANRQFTLAQYAPEACNYIHHQEAEEG